MLYLLKIDYYEFLHPEKTLYKKLLDLYSYSNETNTIKFEMDIVVNDFFIKDFELLLKNFPQHFFFREQLDLNNIEQQKVNLISEICINLINSSEKKLNQLKKYISIIKIFEKLRKENLLLFNENNKLIIDSFLINVSNENIFLFITDGSYLVFRLVVDIVSTILEEDTNLTEIEITNKIKNETQKKIDKTIMQSIGDKSSFDTNIYNIYTMFHNLRKNKIRHCLIYVGVKDENEYEEYLLKYINFDSKNKKEFENYLNKKEPNINDIVINHKISEYINELNNIKYNFCKFLEKSDKDLYSNLKKKKKDISLLFNSVSLEKKELITIKFVVNENLKNEDIIKKLEKYYKKEVEYFTSQENETAMEKLKYSNSDLTFFIDNSYNIVAKFDDFKEREKSNLKGFVYLEASLNKIEDSINLRITKINKTFFKKKFYKYPDVPKNYFNSEGILDFIKLSQKIKDKLKIKIEIKEIDKIVNIKFDDNEKNNYMNNIIKNIDNLNNFINLNQYKEKTDKIKEKYEKKFPLLMENLKASIIYDFIYFSLVPELKFKAFLDYYSLNK